MAGKGRPPDSGPNDETPEAEAPDDGWAEHDPGAIHQAFMPRSAYEEGQKAGPPQGPPAGDDDWWSAPAVQAIDPAGATVDMPALAPPPAGPVAEPTVKSAASAVPAGPAPRTPAEPPRTAPAVPRGSAEPRSAPAAARPAGGDDWNEAGPRAVHRPRGKPELGADPQQVARTNRERQSWRAAATESERRRRRRAQLTSAGGTVLLVVIATAGLWWWRQQQVPAAPPAPAEAPRPLDPAPALVKPTERPPPLIRSGQRRTGALREFTQVRVAAGTARFLDDASGEVLCETAETCDVPVDAAVRIEAPGRAAKILSRETLTGSVGAVLDVTLDPPP